MVLVCGMSFMKRKRFKFQVDFLVADLSDVPLVNAVLFAKLRLLDGGRFTAYSDRVNVSHHRVCWDQLFRFSCQIASNMQTGILSACPCRISVRREVKGGKSFQKLGFVDVNLAEYAGSGCDGISRSYLLEGYRSGSQRQDNSRLRVNITMSLQSLDTCFKVPVQMSMSVGGQLNPADRKAPASTSSHQSRVDGSSDDASVKSGSSGFESHSSRGGRQRGSAPSAADAGAKDATLTAQRQSAASIELPPSTSAHGGGRHHARHESQSSQHSSAGSGGYGSAPTVAACHTANGAAPPSAPPPPPTDSLSRATAEKTKEFLAAHPAAAPSGRSSVVGQTRVDVDDVVAGILRDELNCQRRINSDDADRSEEASGLQLFVSEADGSTAVGGTYERVVVTSADRRGAR